MGNVRWSLLLLVVACDHRPQPKVQVTDEVPRDAARAVPAEACAQIGAKIADIVVASATDATQKAAYEQERPKLVTRFSESCRDEDWSDATRGCFLAAKTSADVEVCSRDLAKRDSR